MNPLAIFAGPYALLAKWAVIALLVLSFGVACWVKGNQHGTAKLTDYIGKQAIEKARIAKARDIVTEKVVTKYIAVQGKTKVVTNTIEKEVVRYAEANPGLCLDARWRVLHDDAAANRLPSPGLQPDATSGAPKAAEALEGVTENYAACHRTADRLDALQSWVRSQAEVK